MILSDKGLVEYMFRVNERYVGFTVGGEIFLKFNGENPSFFENRRRKALIGLLPLGSTGVIVVGSARFVATKVATNQWSLIDDGEATTPNWNGVDATQDLGDWLAY